MKLSVIIVNYNVEHFLEQCLLSVKSSIRDVETEVWVVDNASVDGSLAMLDAKFPWVKRIDNKDNVGFSKANNQAMRLAKGEYVLLLNPDTVIEESTFTDVVRFMDQHPDAGGLGVRMVDGKGVFLPESKRGLPTPWVSFCKIFGISRLFPKSEKFNRYYLGHLPNDEVNEIEILSGAFMLMRKKALDEVGLLDETFFMYGEDIDLSWRLIQGGYKNYYFPDTSIIHYKGESTKKGSLNYVFVFYKAMVIFAKKHFSEKNASLFSFFINLAIYLRAATAIVVRLIKRIFLPIIEVSLFFIGLLILKHYYSEYTDTIYDSRMVSIGFMGYSVLWTVLIALFGGYKKNFKISQTSKGILIGTGIILIVYSLLPEDLRFSRAMILLGTVFVLILSFLLRKTVQFLAPQYAADSSEKIKKYVVIGDKEEVERVGKLLVETRSNLVEIHPLIYDAQGGKEKMNQLEEIVRVYSADEVIFCAKNLSSAEIIKTMSQLTDSRLEIKIAPPESMYIIGSSSIDKVEDLLAYDVNSVSKAKNVRIKRTFDVLTAFSLLILSPVLVFAVQRPFGLFKNMVSVLGKRKTWVSYVSSEEVTDLPKLKPGVLNPAMNLNVQDIDHASKEKINLIYAKDYKVQNDIKTVLGNIKLLGS